MSVYRTIGPLVFECVYVCVYVFFGGGGGGAGRFELLLVMF